MKVVITVQGGSVQFVSSPPGVTVEVLDFDIEGADEEEICHCALVVEGESHFHATFGQEIREVK